METEHQTWLLLAAQANSYRRMYLLAKDIATSEQASSKVRHAACRVVRTLEPVIEQPIATAGHLARARKQFGKLMGAFNTKEMIVK